jgi:arginyl-tRNA synthetase
MNNEELLKNALIEAAKKCGFVLDEADIVIEHSKDPAHGDYATNVAMRSAKKLGKKPLDLAKSLQNELVSDHVEKVEIAGPGFINFFMKSETLGSIIPTILKQGAAYGQSPKNGKKVDVEYVSANPTGDLHLGHTRGAALGDAIANLYAASGYEVTREYYVNNCGNQVEHLGHSLSLRYHELFGEKITLGEDDYHGEDIIKIAEAIKEKDGDKRLADTPENHDFFISYGIEAELAKIKKDLADFGVHFDKFSYESDIRKGTTIPDTIEDLRKKGFVYEEGGATYLKTTAILDKEGKPLDDKDRPIVKSNGMYTYFMPDICYHYNKMSRGFDLLADMLGADHFGYLNRMRAALAMEGYSYDQLAFGIYQIVKVYQDGQEVKMSKRTGKAIAHRDLVADVGKDAVRYFFSAANGDTPINFDMNLALSKSKDNPVYYAQYAHARCHSLLEMGKNYPIDETGVLLKGEKEGAILKHLSDFPSMIYAAAALRAPYKVAGYIQKLAQLVHEYYAATKIIDSADPTGTSARLGLAKAAMIVLENSLALLGVSAPDKM